MLSSHSSIQTALAFISLFSYTSAESVVLANCQNGAGNWVSSEIAWFSGDPSSSPGAAAVVPGTNGGTVYWEGRTVSATFSDGNVFTSHINGGPFADWAYAGPGENKYVGFYCYHHWVPNLYYSSRSGGNCGQVYVCNHNAPHEGLRLDFDIYKDTVDLIGDFNPYDVYGKVWGQRGAAFFDASPVTLTDLCTISFDGHGASDDVMQHLSSTLQEIVGRRDEAAKKTTKEICTKYQTIEHGIQICAQTGTQTVTTMPKTVKVAAVNVPFDGSANSEAGAVTATITCVDPAGVDCGLCKGLGGALGFLSLVGEAASIWGFAGVVTSVVCASEGC